MRALSEGDLATLTVYGFDARAAWVDDVFAAFVNGTPCVEIETLTPYVGHHLDATGQLHFDRARLSRAEELGILLGQLLRDVTLHCPHVRFLSVIGDAYECASRRRVPPSVGERFSSVLSKLVVETEMASPDDLADGTFRLERGSSLLERVGEFTN